MPRMHDARVDEDVPNKHPPFLGLNHHELQLRSLWGSHHRDQEQWRRWWQLHNFRAESHFHDRFEARLIQKWNLQSGNPLNLALTRLRYTGRSLHNSGGLARKDQDPHWGDELLHRQRQLLLVENKAADQQHWADDGRREAFYHDLDRSSLTLLPAKPRAIQHWLKPQDHGASPERGGKRLPRIYWHVCLILHTIIITQSELDAKYYWPHQN